MPSGIIVLRWVYTLAIANLCNYTKNLSFKCMCAIIFILTIKKTFSPSKVTDIARRLQFIVSKPSKSSKRIVKNIHFKCLKCGVSYGNLNHFHSLIHQNLWFSIEKWRKN